MGSLVTGIRMCPETMQCQAPVGRVLRNSVSIFLINLAILTQSVCAYASEQLETVHIIADNNTALSPYDFIGAHQRIDASQFNQSFYTLSSLLEQQSGIDIKSIGGIGQYSSPTIRGSSGQQVLVFWDGLLINGLSGGNADLGNLSLNLASQVDIYRSITPIELSASAVGGVIHIQSPAIDNYAQNTNGQANLTHGNYGLQQYSFMQGFRISDFKWIVAGNFTAADNDFDYLEKSPVSSPNTPSYEPRYNNGTTQQQVLLKGQYKVNQNRYDFAFQAGHSDKELSSKINFPTNQAQLQQDNNSVQFRWGHRHTDMFSSEFITAITDRTEVYDDQYSSIGLGEQLNEYQTSGYSLQLNHAYQIKNFKGLITLRSQSEKTQTHFSLLSENELADQCAAGKGCETEYQRDQYDLGGKLEYDHNQNKVIFQLSRIALRDENIISTDMKNYHVNTTWSASLSHDFKIGNSIYLSLANQVRLPSSLEIFGDRGMSIGNPKLLPEIAMHHEVGMHILHSDFSINSSLYVRDVKQSIVGESDSRGVIHFNNLGRTKHIGTEQTLSWYANQFLTVTANLSLQSNEIIADKRFTFYKGKQVAGYSQFYSYLSAKWQQRHWDLMLSSNYESNGFYDNGNLLPKEIKNRWDASIGINFQEWRISLDGTDLTNNAARDYPFYPEPGRMYFLRAQSQW